MILAAEWLTLQKQRTLTTWGRYTKKKIKHITETETNTAAQQTKQQSDCVYEEKHCTVV